MVLARFGAAIKPSACPHPILHFVCILKLLARVLIVHHTYNGMNQLSFPTPTLYFIQYSNSSSSFQLVSSIRHHIDQLHKHGETLSDRREKYRRRCGRHRPCFGCSASLIFAPSIVSGHPPRAPTPLASGTPPAPRRDFSHWTPPSARRPLMHPSTTMMTTMTSEISWGMQPRSRPAPTHPSPPPLAPR